MVGEKRITKVFEYDTPSELVITYLSEVKGADACLHSSVHCFLTHPAPSMASHVWVFMTLPRGSDLSSIWTG